MVREFVADSEDEGDEADYSPPRDLDGRAIKTKAQTRSSDGVSQITGSTDSVFFESVFNEQYDAARGHTSGGLGNAGMNQPGQHDAAYDPWAIPSSPESQSQDAGPVRYSKREIKISSSRPTRETVLVNTRSGPSQKEQEDDDSHEYLDGGNPKPLTKRRKLEHLDDCLKSSDEVDLVLMPSQSSMPSFSTPDDLVSTLPVNRNTSFYITSTLKSSQRQDGDSLNETFGKRKELPLSNHNNIPHSSGSLTNINTPRSLDQSPYGSMLSHPSKIEESTTQAMAMAPPPRGRRGSSPDVITTMEAEESSKKIRWKGRTATHNETSPAKIINVDICHEEEASTGTHETAGPSIHAEILPTTKPKKQRGRPKKKVEGAGAAPTPEAPEPEAKEKKKRGRPKKSGSKLPKPEDNIDPKPTTVALEPLCTDMDEVAPGGRNSSYAGNMTDQKEHASYGEQGEGNGAILKETSHNRVMGKGSETPEAEPEGELTTALDPTTAQERKETPTAIGAAETETGGTLRDKGGNKAGSVDSIKGRGSSWIAGTAKPLYRVGLSKRRRIAPLLKSLRK